MKVKAIQLLANSVLPEDLRDYNRTYDKGSIDQLMSAIADNYPDQYAKIVKDLADVGRNASYIGGQTLTLNDFRPMFDKDKLLSNMWDEVDVVKKTIKNKEERKNKINEIYAKYAELLDKLTMQAGETANNNLFNAVKSGARGNSTQLKALTTAPALFTDAKGNIIPMFVDKSYGEGLDLEGYLASQYGARSAVVTNKRSTAAAGFVGKLMNLIGAPYMVNKSKDESPEDVGLVLDPTSPEAYGRVLAKDVMGLKRGTILDKDTQSFLRKHKVDKVLVHSPIASVSGEGISAEAYGLDYNKRLPPIGYAAGMTSGQAIGEPLAQNALNAKHTCLWSDTEVKMADGSIKKIKDIEIGDEVLGSDKQGNVRPVKVLKKFDQGIQPCYKWTFKSGQQVTCTDEHKFLTEENKVIKLKEL